MWWARCRPTRCLKRDPTLPTTVLMRTAIFTCRAKSDELIYFRFTRYSLYRYTGGELTGGVGNENDLSFNNTSFRFGNYQLQSSSQWGSGIQYPLALLPVDCEVNLVVKSQLGLTSEIAEVVPYMYHIRYYRPKI